MQDEVDEKVNFERTPSLANISDDQIKNFKKSFDLFDKNKDGVIFFFFLKKTSSLIIKN